MIIYCLQISNNHVNKIFSFLPLKIFSLLEWLTNKIKQKVNIFINIQIQTYCQPNKKKEKTNKHKS